MKKLILLLAILITSLTQAQNPLPSVAGVAFDTIAVKPTTPFSGELVLDNNYDFTVWDAKQSIWKPIGGSAITAGNGITDNSGTFDLGGTLNSDITWDLGVGRLGARKLSVIDALQTFLRIEKSVGEEYAELKTGKYNVSLLDTIMRIGETSNNRIFTWSPSTGANDVVFTGANGLRYAADYSANYVNRSLVDKQYVDNAVPVISESTFVPTIVDSGGTATFSYTSGTGYSYKVGKKTFVKVEISGISVSGTPSGSMTIQGMPFPSNDDYALSIAQIFDIGVSFSQMNARIEPSGIKLIYKSNDTGDDISTSFLGSSISSGLLNISGTYISN